MKRVPGQDNVSHKIKVAFRFFVSDVSPFDCLCLFCAINIRVHLITHSLFMIYSCSLIGMCMRSRLCVRILMVVFRFFVSKSCHFMFYTISVYTFCTLSYSVSVHDIFMQFYRTMYYIK